MREFFRGSEKDRAVNDVTCMAAAIDQKIVGDVFGFDRILIITPENYLTSKKNSGILY